MTDPSLPFVVDAGVRLRDLTIAVTVRPFARPASFRARLGARLIELGARVAGFRGARFRIERASD